MSGGPVFDESGYLVGITSSSFDGTDDEGDYFSSATLLWPLMGVRVDFPRADVPEGTVYPVLDLADAGLIGVEGRELVSLEPGSEPGTISIRFQWP